MAQQTINVGAAPNDGTGTPLRTAFQYTNSNFSELYTAVGPSGNNIVCPGSATITGALTVNGGVNLANATAINFGGLLTIYSDTAAGLFIRGRTVTGTTFQTQDGTNPLLNISNSGVHTFYDGAGGTRMTLNSTGLGVGGSPNDKLEVVGSGGAGIRVSRAGVSSQYTTLSAGATGPSLDASSAIGALTFGVAGSTKMTVDTSGNVGIGVTPSAAIANNRKLEIVGTINSAVVLGSNSSNASARNWATASNWNAYGDLAFLQSNALGGDPLASGAGTTRMTLDASGRLLVGTANASVTSETGCRLLLNNGATGHFTVAVTTNQSTAATSCYDFYSTSAAAYRFYVTSAGVINATNTTISAISDARLKENVQDIDVGLGAILALKPRKFDWKAGKGKDIKGDRGFIAQEFEQVFPQLVDEWKDAAPEGEAPYKSVRQDLIPVLVKAIQELTARVQTLETR